MWGIPTSWDKGLVVGTLTSSLVFIKSPFSLVKNLYVYERISEFTILGKP